MVNREEVFYDKLKSEYEEFLEELEEYDAKDFIENAEYIAAIKEIYEYLERDKPVKTDEQLGYFLKLRNPLNFMCEQYLSDKAPIYDSFNQTLWRMEQERKLDYKTNAASEELKKILCAEYESDGIHYAAKLKLYAAENLIKGILKCDFCFDEYDAKILMQFKKPFAVLLDNYTDSRIADFAEQFDGIIEKLNSIDLFTSPYTMQKDKILPETKHRHNAIIELMDIVPDFQFQTAMSWLDLNRTINESMLDGEDNPYHEFLDTIKEIKEKHGDEVLQKVFDMGTDIVVQPIELTEVAKYIADGGDVDRVSELLEDDFFLVPYEQHKEGGMDLC